MNKIYRYLLLIIISSIFLAAGQAIANEEVKVLMLKEPYTLPSPQTAETIDTLQGKIFINGEFYSGSFEIIRDEKGLYIIKKIPLENYLQTTVASKVCREWEIEEIKAQVVISRTYAHYHMTLNAGKKFHFSSNILPPRNGENNKYPLIIYAIKETKGEILTYNNSPAEVRYQTTCKSRTGPRDESKRKNYIELLSDYFPGAVIQNMEELHSQSVSSGD